MDREGVLPGVDRQCDHARLACRRSPEAQKANWDWALANPRTRGRGPRRRPEDFMRADIVILGDPNQASNRKPALG
jgi:hypothetical protein